MNQSTEKEDKKNILLPKKREGIALKTVMIGISVLFLVYFILVPMVNLIIKSVFVDGTLDFSNYAKVYSESVN